MTPTARSLEWLRDNGWHAEVVERWIPGANVRKDLLGFIDVLAFKDGQVLAVQTTSTDNVSARVRKIADAPTLPIARAAGWTIHVHGWAKRGTPQRWTLRTVDVS